MITKATAKQWAEIESLKARWIAKQSEQPDDEQVRSVVRRMWAAINQPSPAVIILDSPLAAIVGAAVVMQILGDTKQLYSQLDSQLYSQLRSQLDSQLRSQLDSLSEHARKQPWYLSVWWAAYSGWYAGGQVLGVKFDEEKLRLFVGWADTIPLIVPYQGITFVSRKPTELHWRDGVLHNDIGMSVRFRDDWGLYSLGGVQVDEQIVMQPHMQTIEQIRGEPNEEIKRLRIERYGWDAFLDNINAEQIDTRRNLVEGSRESLYRADGMTVLVCPCPSTAKVFALEVPPEVRTCENAQLFLSSGLSSRIISAA